MSNNHNPISTIIVYVCMFALVLGSILYSNYAVKENGRKFCDIITTVNDAYQDPNVTPPATELGEKLKKNYADLEKRLGC